MATGLGRDNAHTARDGGATTFDAFTVEKMDILMRQSDASQVIAVQTGEGPVRVECRADDQATDFDGID